MAELTEVQRQMRADEEAVERLLEVYNNLTWDQIQEKLGWSTGRVSDALYCVVHDRKTVEQSSRDAFSCTYKFIG